jgi:hypothetical protein
MKRDQRIACIRGMDRDLWARIKQRARLEGMRLRDWIERAFIRELARENPEQQAAAES